MLEGQGRGPGPTQGFNEEENPPNAQDLPEAPQGEQHPALLTSRGSHPQTRPSRS